jgi:hypothetical protein
MKKTALAASVIVMGLSLAVLAADDTKQREDLSAVIALHAKPCGEVVSYVKQADNDFIATCKDGNRYRVYVKDGRVVVEKK